ncbi:MAG: right-handed parallel beta-helix repeat-containing protein, partial [Promethearchaeota archaeon]
MIVPYESLILFIGFFSLFFFRYKKGRKSSFYLFLILFSFILLISCPTNLELNQRNNNIETHDEDIPKYLKESGYWLVDHIEIDQNDAAKTWEVINQTYPWCTGNGIVNDPYIIENVSINAIDYEIGISISGSKGIYFIIKNNIIQNATIGIQLENTDGGMIINNTISNNKNIGILIHNCKKNNLIDNEIRNNTNYGIFLNGPNSKNNNFYKNKFFENGRHAIDDAKPNFNSWYNSSIGNYWDNYTGKDTNDDNIGDIPYDYIFGKANSQDLYPIWWDAPKLLISYPSNYSTYGTFAADFKVVIDEGKGDTFWYEIANKNSSSLSLSGEIDEEIINVFEQDLWDNLNNGTHKIRFYVNDSKGYIGIKNIIVKLVIPSLDNWWNSSYTYRVPLKLVNKYTKVLPEGYSVNVSINTVNLISAGKLRDDGKDLRIVWYNASDDTWMELNRINETYFNTVDTRIWFKTQSSVIPNTYDGSYYLYYGCNDCNEPLTNKSKIYDFFDDFDQPDGPAKGWNVINGTWSINNNEYLEQQFVVDGRSLLNTYTIENASIEILINSSGGNFGAGVMFRHQNNQNFYAAGIGFWEYEVAIGKWTNDAPYTLDNTLDNESVLMDSQWYHLKIEVLGSNYLVYLNGILKNNITDTDHLNPGQIGLMTWTTSAISSFDDLKIRLLVPNEPIIFLGSEEALKPQFNYIIEAADPIELGNNVDITVNVTDLIGIIQVLIEFNENNYSMIYIGGDLWQNDTWTPPSTGNYTYIIYAQNFNLKWNSIIGSIQVIDTTPPTFSDLIESSDPLELGNIEKITINASDFSGIHQVLLEIEGSNYSMVNINGNRWQYDAWIPDSIGIKPYTIHIEDNNNNWINISDLINVIDTVDPVLIINEPSEGQPIGSTSPHFNVIILDKSLESMWYILNTNPIKHFFDSNNSIDQTAWNGLLDGPNTIYFYANDSAGNENFKSINVYKDSNYPSVNIISPLGNELFNNTIPDFTVRISEENLDKMWYIFNAELVKHFFLENGTLGGWSDLSDGQITITFYANDTAGNLASAFVMVYKDTNIPSINIISPIGGQFYNNTPPSFTVEISDNNLDKMWYTLNTEITKYYFETNASIDVSAWNSIPDGIVNITFYANDTAGNVQYDKTQVNKDTVLPTGSIEINGDATWSTSTTVTLTLTYSDDNSGVNHVRYSNDGISWSPWQSPIDVRSWTLSPGDGFKTVYYEIKDNAGSVSQFNDTIGLDTVDPTGSIEINGGAIWTTSINITLTLTYDDATSGVLEVRYSNDGSSWTGWEAANATKAWTLNPSNGIKTVYYEIKDNAGSVSQFNDTIGLDTVDPTGSIDINGGDTWSTSASVTLTLTYNDATSGIDLVRYSNDGTSWTGWEAASATRAWTLNPSNGIKIVYYEIRDIAGRVSQFNDTIGFDTLEPSGSIVINNGDAWTASTSVTLTLTYNDATSGIDQVRYRNEGGLWTAWEAVSDTRIWTLTSGDGTKTVYYEIMDKAGLVFQTNDTIELDTTGPTGSIIINDGDIWTNSTSIILSLFYDDITSGVDQVRYSNDSISWSPWEAATDTRLWTLPSGDGPKTVYYQIMDNVGLIYQSSDTIGLDTIHPSGSIIINSDDAWTTSPSVTLTLTYNDATSGVSEVRYSNDGSSWTAWEAPSTTKTWVLSFGDGTRMVYYEIKDNAGLTYQINDTIGLDTTRPTGSIEINGGYLWTNTTSVSLALTYYDATSGVLEVRYSNDGSSWTAWEMPSDTREWTLSSGNGYKIVYYEIRDNASLIFQTNDTIGLDTTHPTGTIIINSDNAWTSSISVTLTLTYEDTTSGVLEVRYSNDGISWTDWETPSATKAWILTTGDEISKVVYYQVKDNASLIFEDTDTIGLDTTLPIGSIIINNDDVWSTSTSVTLTLTYNDATSGIDQVRYRNEGGSWTSWQAASATRSWTLTSEDGVKTVYYEIRDNAGLIFQTNDTIELDTTGPTGSIEINDDDTWTNSTSVILTLIYDDITSGVDQVRYSNDSIDWTPWEAASDTRAWTLPSGDGPKTVYYEIRNNAGIISQFIDTIGLDTTDPIGTIIINNDEEWSTSPDVILTLTYNDVTSGVVQVRY